MADPKYPEYNGVLRFDDDNLVEVGLQPDTENITVKLNGVEISGGGGAGLPEVDSSDNGDVLTVVEGAWTNAAPASQLPAVSSSDNGDVLTVVEGAWANAAPASQLPAVSSSDNGNVLTVVEGSWAKAAPAGGESDVLVIHVTYDEQADEFAADYTYAQIAAAIEAGKAIFLIDDSFFLYSINFDLTTGNLVFTTPVMITTGSTAGHIKIFYHGVTITDQDVVTKTGGRSASVSGDFT